MAQRKTYNVADVMRTFKLTRATAQNVLRKTNAPKDEMGYYNWSKPQYDKVMRSIRNELAAR